MQEGLSNLFGCHYIIYIRECGSTLYVGLTGMLRMLIQTSVRMVWRILSISFFFIFLWMSNDAMGESI